MTAEIIYTVLLSLCVLLMLLCIAGQIMLIVRTAQEMRTNRLFEDGLRETIRMRSEEAEDDD